MDIVGLKESGKKINSINVDKEGGSGSVVGRSSQRGCTDSVHSRAGSILDGRGAGFHPVDGSITKH